MRWFSIAPLVATCFLLIACAANSTDGSTGDTAERPAEDGEVTPIEIGETGGMCGGIAGFQCANASDYCAMDEGRCVDIADAAGVCAPKPEACTMDYSPVCGCDGETYSNGCTAAASGVSVAHSGECSSQ